MNQPLTAELLRSIPLPRHAEDADKNDRGLAFFIAGSRELSGAAQLAGSGALRAGAGKLRIAAARSIASGLGVAIPEARVIGFSEDEEGCIEADAIAHLVERCRQVNSLTIGPGLQHGEGLRRLLHAILATRGDYPLIVDAAALGMLPDVVGEVADWPGGAILLPHTGEMARLIGRSRAEVEADRGDAAHMAARLYGAVVLTKGAPGIVVAPDGSDYVYPGGGVGLATSGSGDVLAGIVGGLAARGADPLTATLWGVYLHGEAGRELAKQTGRIGFLARELLDPVPRLMAALSPEN